MQRDVRGLLTRRIAARRRLGARTWIRSRWRQASPSAPCMVTGTPCRAWRSPPTAPAWPPPPTTAPRAPGPRHRRPLHHPEGPPGPSPRWHSPPTAPRRHRVSTTRTARIWDAAPGRPPHHPRAHRGRATGWRSRPTAPAWPPRPTRDRADLGHRDRLALTTLAAGRGRRGGHAGPRSHAGGILARRHAHRYRRPATARPGLWPTATGHPRITLKATGRRHRGGVLARRHPARYRRRTPTGPRAPGTPPPAPAPREHRWKATTRPGHPPVAFSPDGTPLATASYGRSRAELGRGHRPPPHHPGRTPATPVAAAAFAPDGTPPRLPRSGDGTARTWHAVTGSRPAPPCTGHPARLTAVAFSPDGTLVATAGPTTAPRAPGRRRGTAPAPP